MSDEEKAAIKHIKSELDINEFMPRLVFDDEDIKILISLIEKQSKEIEELKNKNKKLQDKAKELIFEKQELTSALLDSTPDDKIKAKIEELDKDENASIPDFMEYAKEYAKGKLQSLLEKE